MVCDINPETTAEMVQKSRLDTSLEHHHLRPIVTVEVTYWHSEVTGILFKISYRLFAPTGMAISASQLKSG